MTYVMICEGYVERDDCPHVGQYLQFYNADWMQTDTDEVGKWTSEIEKAMKFKSVFDVILLWKTPLSHYPMRPDGKSNRPLTAFSISVGRI